MSDLHFQIAVRHAVGKDPRYHPHAYEFVRDALHVAVKKFREGQEDQHVSGQEVLEGVRQYALDEFGPMTLTLLNMWGLHRGEDVGNVVYNLIDTGYFGKNEGDSLEDFSGGYDFNEAFTKPFEPRSASSRAN